MLPEELANPIAHPPRLFISLIQTQPKVQQHSPSRTAGLAVSMRAGALLPGLSALAVITSCLGAQQLTGGGAARAGHHSRWRRRCRRRHRRTCSIMPPELPCSLLPWRAAEQIKALPGCENADADTYLAKAALPACVSWLQTPKSLDCPADCAQGLNAASAG